MRAADAWGVFELMDGGVSAAISDVGLKLWVLCARAMLRSVLGSRTILQIYSIQGPSKSYEVL